MQRRFFVGAAALALIAGGGGYVYSTTSQTQGPGLGAANAQDAAEVDISGITEMALGDADAPVTLIEYASFTCPHCASFHKNTFGKLKADYIDTGKVRFIYREVYFDKFGLWAAMIARCGGEARFFGITDLIYEKQREWLDAKDESGIVENLKGLGRAAGLSDEDLNACLQDADKAKTLVARYQQQATEHDINATPSFVIDGETHANMSYEDMRAILDEKLSG